MPKRGKRGKRGRKATDDDDLSDDEEVGPSASMDLDLASTDDDEEEEPDEEEKEGKAERGGDDSEQEDVTDDDDDDDDSSVDDDEAEEYRSAAIDTAWGRSASQYYSGDTADLEIGQDFAEAKEEEEIAIATQRAHRAREDEADFMLDLVVDDDAGEDDEDDAVKSKKKKKKKSSNSSSSSSSSSSKKGVKVVTMARDFSGLSAEEKLAHIRSEAPETLGILQELAGHIREARQLRRCIDWVRAQEDDDEEEEDDDDDEQTVAAGGKRRSKREGGERGQGKGMVTAEGMSYLELRSHLLMSFIYNANFYVMLQAQATRSSKSAQSSRKSMSSGGGGGGGLAAARGHPVLDTLLKLRHAIVRLKPLERGLRGDLELLRELATATAETTKAEDKLAAGERAVPGKDTKTKTFAGIDEEDDDEDDEEEEEEEEEEDEEDEEKGSFDRSTEQEERRFAKKVAQSAARARNGEGSMSKSKQGKVGRKENRRVYADLGTDVGDVEGYAGETANEAAKKLQVSFNTMVQKQRKAARAIGPGGDADVPALERARRLPATSSLLSQDDGDGGDCPPWEEGMFFSGPGGENNGGGGGDELDGRDDGSSSEGKKGRGGKGSFEVEGDDDDNAAAVFYRQMAAVRDTKKRKRSEKYRAPKRVAGTHTAADLPGDEKRAASYQIMKNRGLVASKAKINRNPRVKKKEQYRRKVIARKGQVRDIRDSAEGAFYGGEATGIKVNVARGRKIQN
jgi:U3 small nucleolar RNA-associated protein 3